MLDVEAESTLSFHSLSMGTRSDPDIICRNKRARRRGSCSSRTNVSWPTTSMTSGWLGWPRPRRYLIKRDLKASSNSASHVEVDISSDCALCCSMAAKSNRLLKAMCWMSTSTESRRVVHKTARKDRDCPENVCNNWVSYAEREHRRKRTSSRV